MSQVASVIDEIESALSAGSAERRTEVLRRVTDLFLGNADQFNDDQVELFGDVLAHLIDKVEAKALAELGAKLAPVGNAPRSIIRNLAHHNEITVAGPVLARSPQLTDGDLVEIAETKSQDHLGAISERARVAPAVTDVLVQRGDVTVVHKLSQNQGASFSNASFVTLAKRAETDGDLAENLGLRLDMPPQLLQDLLAKATEAVRARLQQVAPPEGQAVIQDVLASVSDTMMREASAPRDFRHAVAVIDNLREHNELHEAVIAEFAGKGKYEEVVVGLAWLCAAPVDLVERLMQNVRYDGLIVACKSIEMHWPTVSAILKIRLSYRPISAAELAQARTDFLKLSVASARRMFRFWLVRGTVQA